MFLKCFPFIFFFFPFISNYLIDDRKSFRDRLIFTDIDGTITKSDVKGFVHGSLENYLPSVKGLQFKSDVHHEGVVKFLNKAANNGYTIIYLTARPIDFDSQTRKYLFSSLQNRDGGYSLPESALFSGAKVDVEQCGLNDSVSYNPSIVKSTTIRAIINLFDLREKVSFLFLFETFLVQ